ncbi:DUF3732 domain-containing protein [Burkholderia anthina]|uniref:DUF3732 domain-containing protein n=1 Tax=Burkholderia anthina TaxID=179879 RepID=UPI000F599A67|nr:DUF3732 domain-containing protein [Burkholderia anthina]RQV78354.1 DUF3732 domain-containing protein [Burkholderia anthina]
MTMQIKSIVLYHKDGRVRELKFRLGALNVITGESRTGKSAIIDIVDYCLGRSTFGIFEGVNRDVVAWYAVMLRVGNTDVFSAKPAPKGNAASQSSVYLQVGSQLALPTVDQLVVNTNDEALIQQLSGLLRISPNLSVPEANHTREPLQATLAHTKHYLFQEQGEIANRAFLFHRQNEQFMPQAIKDTLPYLVGAVPEDRLALVQQEREVKRQLRLYERRQREASSVGSSELSQSAQLVNEAKAVGLLGGDSDAATLARSRALLEEALQWKPGALQSRDAGVSQLELNIQLDRARAEYSELYDSLIQARLFELESQNFTEAVSDQAGRLRAIDIVPADESPTNCPLCGSAHTTPEADELRQALVALEEDLADVQAQRPRLLGRISELETRVSDARQKVQALRQQLRITVGAEDDALAQRDAETRIAKVIGRISLYLESVNELRPDAGLEGEITALKAKLAVLEELLNQESLEEELASILNRIGSSMTQLAERLDLELKCPYRLDLTNLTVVADADRPVPMARMGSGSNWLGCHLIALLALHKHFVEQERPVPGFLIIDQPSQVYFPSTSYRQLDGTKEGLEGIKDRPDTDISAVHRMFRVLYETVQELSPNFQIIVTEHANLPDDWYQKSLVEQPWRDGRALIPRDWLK